MPQVSQKYSASAEVFRLCTTPPGPVSVAFCCYLSIPAGFPPSEHVLVRLYPETLTRAASRHPAPPAPAPAHRARPPEPPYPPPGHSAYHRSMYWKIERKNHGGDLAIVFQVHACDPRSFVSAAASPPSTLCVSRGLQQLVLVQNTVAPEGSAWSRRSAKSACRARPPAPPHPPPALCKASNGC